MGGAELAPELAAVPAAEKAAVALCQRASRDTAAKPATQQLWFQILQVHPGQVEGRSVGSPGVVGSHIPIPQV